MEKLKLQRQVIKSSLTRIYNACIDQNVILDDIKPRTTRAEELFKQFEQVQLEIDGLATTQEQLALEDAYRGEIEEKYFAIKTAYSRLLNEVESNRTVVESQQSSNEITSAMQALVEQQGTMGTLLERITRFNSVENSSTPIINSQNNTQHSQNELRLPPIQIPEFDGQCTEWIRFRDLFETLVHNRMNISEVEKLEYLQSKVRGEALSLIKHLKPANANYQIAWQILCDKYNNSGKVKHAYLRLLIDQPSIKVSHLAEVKRLFNTTNESINALRVLDEPVQYWNSILLFILEKKLDAETHVLWYRQRKSNEEATYMQFLQFLESRVFELENTQKSASRSSDNSEGNTRRTQQRSFSATMQQCPICKTQHFLFQCEQFKAMSVDERRKVVVRENLCFNCLQPNHRVAECQSSSCKKCDNRHNTLLHRAKSPNSAREQQTNIRQQQSDDIQQQPNDIQQQPHFGPNIVQQQYANLVMNDEIISSVNSSQQQGSCTLLPTAIVMVTDKYSIAQPCRALLDSGSQCTIISEACAQRLQLRRRMDETILFGVGPNKGNRSKGKVQLTISGAQVNKSIVTEALCLSNLTQNMPLSEVDVESMNYFKHLPFADASFNKPGKVDIILGVDVLPECLLPNKVTHPKGNPTAMQTIFGWVFMGKVTMAQPEYRIIAHTCMDINDQLQRFWEIENIDCPKHHYTSDELKAEEHFKEHVQQTQDGRYMVRLPTKDTTIELGESRTTAENRLCSMERRFSTNPQLKEEYRKFIKEYIQLGHMEPSTVSNTIASYYMPHHAVIKPSSTSTKLRVVFDASCKSSNGFSLNDKLLVGPTIQNDIFTILIKFRKYEIGFSADIEKMYRQVIVHPKDRPLQRIVWRDSPNEQVKSYDLCTVTYGTAAAPFLATRTLHEIAHNNTAKHHEAAATILDNFYVDDLMACTMDISKGIVLKDEISQILSSSGFHLRKWSSNAKRFLESIDIQDRELSSDAIIDNSQAVKTLGLLWDTSTDDFKYSVILSTVSQSLTKRDVLSDIARIYDPLGWLSPVVVALKILMQKLWLQGIGWDDELPASIRKQWHEYRQTINDIADIRIPRWLQYANEEEVELHGFSDASESAYAAAVYLRIHRRNKEIITNLIASKTKVAPIKQVTLPRLELCAAHLLVKLLTKVRTSLNICPIKMFGWTDSSIVLAWLSDHPRRWKTFVANRAAQIIDVVPAEFWYHISSDQNPADLATRGIRPAELKHSELWWQGPEVLRKPLPLRQNCAPLVKDVNMEERVNKVTCHATSEDIQFIDSYSNLSHLLRITALLLRFINNCKAKLSKEGSIIGFITSPELQVAHDTLVKISQGITFATEIRILTMGKQLPISHKLAALAPFVDAKGLLRVGGRITNAHISYNQMHPYILDKDQHLTKLIVQEFHSKNLHAGTRQLQYLLGVRYWIQGIRHIIKQCVYKCVKCMRFRGRAYQQQMGNLPRHRLEPGPAFLNTGIDFAGPFQVRSWKGRGSKRYKCWIALFICLVTKAIHVELVTELSTAAFIASLRRFVARRGRPMRIYSDNGTNFVGAHQQLRDLYQFLNTSPGQEAINKELSKQQIEWHFSPPSGPHFGGIWEAGVKSVKHHLKRVLGDALVTYEEFSTVLCQIESCLNSRPLCLKFEDDVDPLTPAHFLILRAASTIPDTNPSDLKQTCLNRWKYLQQLVNSLWQRWSIEYISQLQQRSRWSQRLKNIQVGDIVVIKDDNTAPSQWSLGRVSQIHPGSDNLVRVVTLKTAKGSFKRPITKLCPLFVDC